MALGFWSLPPSSCEARFFCCHPWFCLWTSSCTLRTFVITWNLPEQKTRIFLAQGQLISKFNSTCTFNSPLPCNLTQSRVLELGCRQLWGPLFCLPQWDYGLFCSCYCLFHSMYIFKFLYNKHGLLIHILKNQFTTWFNFLMPISPLLSLPQHYHHHYHYVF